MVEESDLVGSECKPKQLNKFDRNSLQNTLGLVGSRELHLSVEFSGSSLALTPPLGSSFPVVEWASLRSIASSM